MKQPDQDRVAAGFTLAIGAVLFGAYLVILMNLWGPKIWDRSRTADPAEDAVAADFSLFWSASYLTLAGEPAAVYDRARLHQVEEAATGKKTYFPWPYPPTFLLLVAPLSLAPYLGAVFIWLALTMALYLFVIRLLAPHPWTIFLSLAFPGTFLNFTHGQNGFLSAALLGGGLLLLARAPFIAGMLIGLLSYKPHLAVLPVMALVAGRHWKSLGGAVTSAAGLALLSFLILGPGPWTAFWKNAPMALRSLETGATPLDKMPTVFAAAHQAGLGLAVTWLFQGIIMAVVTGAIFWVWFREASAAVRSAVLVGGILLFTPYVFYYDFALMAIPLALLWQEGRVRGWMPVEQTLLILIWALPLATFLLAVNHEWPLGAIVVVGLFVLALTRFFWEQGSRSPRKETGLGGS